MAKGVASAGLVAALVSALWLSPTGDHLETALARWLEFNARTALGMAPVLAPTIKVFEFDDPTVRYMNAPDLHLRDWLALLQLISAQKPKVIFVDKLFTFSSDGPTEAARFVDAVRQTGTPVVAGSFYTEGEIKSQDQMVIEAADYSLSRLYQGEVGAAFRPTEANLPWLPILSRHFYGPAHELIQAFTHVGHLVHLGDGYTVPLVRGQVDYAVPHAAFFVTDDLRIDERGLIANGHRVPVDGHGRLLTNLISPSTYPRLNVRRMLETVAHGNGPAAPVAAGDIVAILPAMFAGSTDMKDTALGRMPGGYLQVALINSVVTGNWIDFPAASATLTLFLIWGGAISGMLFAMLFYGWGILMSLFAAPVAAAMLGIAAFAYGSMALPWLFPSFAFIATSVLLFAERYRATERRAVQLKAALGWSLAPDKLQQLIKHPTRLQVEPTEQTVTIMFLDIVGFSLLAERQTPKEGFDELKSIFTLLRRLVYLHEGVVDRSLGDGLLCFFGYNYERSRPTATAGRANHADQAWLCAIAIQRACLEYSLANHAAGKPVYPLRIGMHTATVYIGDLGDERAMDFTLIGHGVNHAKRIEEAGELYRIMLTPTTHDLLGSVRPTDQTLVLRQLQIKHHKEAIEAYEYDPFRAAGPESEDAKNLSLALKAYNAYHGFERTSPRFMVPEHCQVSVRVGEPHGQVTGRLVDFSTQGCAVELSRYYARGVDLSLFLSDGGESGAGALADLLRTKNMLPIACEVRWGRPRGDTFVHGLIIKNLNGLQKENFVIILRELLERMRAKGGDVTRPLAAS